MEAYRYGVPKIVDGTIVEIIEKPMVPETSLAVTGLYFYDPTVYEIIANLRPSERGELEITDVNNQYAYRKALRHITYTGRWIDAGTHEALKSF